MTAMQVVGYKADLSYNIALCHYMMKQYAPALKHIADIIERGIREHPGMDSAVTSRGIIIMDTKELIKMSTKHQCCVVTITDKFHTRVY
jgi:tetratricopeptide repeat protein 30